MMPVPLNMQGATYGWVGQGRTDRRSLVSREEKLINNNPSIWLSKAVYFVQTLCKVVVNNYKLKGNKICCI